jgi:tetratricopeptide (TPR) repeat protein
MLSKGVGQLNNNRKICKPAGDGATSAVITHISLDIDQKYSWLSFFAHVFLVQQTYQLVSVPVTGVAQHIITIHRAPAMNKLFLATFTALALLASSAFADKLEDANTAFAAGDLAAAELNYQAAIGMNRKNAGAFLGLGRLYLVWDQFNKSAKAIKTGLRYTKSKPQKLDLLAAGIRLEDARGDYRKAKSYYSKAKRVRGSKAHAEIHMAMANATIASRRYEDAEKLLTIVLALKSPFTEEAVRAPDNMQLIKKAVAITDSDLAYSSAINRSQVARSSPLQ